MSVSAFGSVAPRDPRRPERGRTMERRHGFRVLCPSWRDGQQPPGRPRDQHARAAPDSELHGLHQHVDDSETTGAAALAREADTPRLRWADPADLGTRESVWPIRSRHEYAIGVAVIEMAPGDTTVGSTPDWTLAYDWDRAGHAGKGDRGHAHAPYHVHNLHAPGGRAGRAASDCPFRR